MSAEEELRVELLAEIARSGQDLEQCNEKTGRYSRDFLYNVRDLEQLFSITECPVTSHQMIKFDCFPTKENKNEKNFVQKAYTYLKDRVMKGRRVKEEAARIESEKIQQEVKMLRKKTARLEWEREEAKDRERQESARIEKERTEKVEKEEIRLLSEKGVFSLISLPRKLKMQIYRYIDLEGRRALRINEELAEIEEKTRYRHTCLTIITMHDHVVLVVDNNRKIIHRFCVNHSEVEKELEIMAKNTQFDNVCFQSICYDNRQIMSSVKSLQAKEVYVYKTLNLNDSDLQSIAPNRDNVYIRDQTTLTENGLFWIYEKMRNRQLNLKCADLEISKSVRWNFLDKSGTFDRESLVFTSTNPNQEVCDHEYFISIDEGKLKMIIDKRGETGKVKFEYRSGYKSRRLS